VAWNQAKPVELVPIHWQEPHQPNQKDNRQGHARQRQKGECPGRPKVHWEVVAKSQLVGAIGPEVTTAVQALMATMTLGKKYKWKGVTEVETPVPKTNPAVATCTWCTSQKKWEPMLATLPATSV